MNNDMKMYLIFENLFTQKKYAEYIRYFVENQEQYKRATTLDNEKKLQTLNWLAESFVQEKDLVQAKRFFDYLIKVAPTDSRAYLGLINLIKDEKNWQELIEFCQVAKGNYPELWQAYWWTGHAYRILKQYDEAIEQFNILNNQFSHRHQGLQGLTETFYNLKDWQQTIEHGLKLQAKNPKVWQAYWWAGHAYRVLKQFSEAKQQFGILNNQFSNRHQGLQGLTETTHNAKDWQQTIEYGLQLQAKNPNVWQSYVWIGHAYKNLHEYDKAETEFNRLIELFPDNPKGREGLAQLAQHRQNSKKN